MALRVNVCVLHMHVTCVYCIVHVCVLSCVGGGVLAHTHLRTPTHTCCLPYYT